LVRWYYCLSKHDMLSRVMAIVCHTVHHTHVNVSFACIYSILRVTFLYDQTEYLTRPICLFFKIILEHVTYEISNFIHFG